MAYILNDDFNGGTFVTSSGATVAGSSGVLNTLPSSAIWNIPTGVAGDTFNGSAELVYYTGAVSNLYQDGDSNLCFTVGKQGTDGAPSNLWPSGYVDTSAAPGPQAAGTPRYAVPVGGSCEIRVKVNPLVGLWTACWFIGGDAEYVDPDWAEIDMEEAGDQGAADPSPSNSQVTIWGGDAPDGTPLATAAVFNVGDGNFHIFRLDLEENSITITVDNATVYGPYTPSNTDSAGGAWNFNNTVGMYVILQIHMQSAVSSTPAAASLPFLGMLVDYVRIWEPAGPNPNAANTTATGSIAVPKPKLSGTGSVTASGAFTASGGLQVPKPAMGGTIANGTTGTGGAMSTLVDTFGSNDLSTQWGNTYGTVTVAGGACSIQADTAYDSSLGSTNTYDLVGSYIFGQFTPYIYADGEFALQLYLNATNLFTFEYTGGQLAASITQAGVTTYGPSVTYNATNYAWWRIREASGVLYFDTAPDGSTWVNFWFTPYTMAVTALLVTVYAGVYSPGTVTGTAYVSNINVSTNALQTLVDGFGANDLATVWSNSYGTVAVASNECSIQADSSYDSGIASSESYAIVSSYIFGQFTPYIYTDGETGLQVYDASGNQATIGYVGGSMFATMLQGGVKTSGPPVAYSATAHAWWRIRESMGTMYFDAAPDGLTWTNIWSSTYTMNPTAVTALVYAGTYGAATAGYPATYSDVYENAPGTAYVTDINVVPIITSGSIAVPKPALAGSTGAATTMTGSLAAPKPGLGGQVTVGNQIVGLGTPVMVRSTTGSVTGTWGTGQLTTAGDGLLAVVSAAAATSVTAITGPAGWVKQAESANTATSPHADVAMFTLTAVGGDAAPTFTSTLTGTGAMTVTLIELPGMNQIAPADVFGLYASGATAGTLSAMSATTSGAVGTGLFAVSAFVQEAAAATNTWNEDGTGFSNAVNDGSTSSVAHTAVSTNPAPTGGSDAVGAGNWSTDTSAYGAGLVIVLLPVFVQGGGLISLTDSFGANDLATLWANTYGTVTVSGGEASIDTDTSYDSALVSTSKYYVYGNYIFGQFGPYTTDGTAVLALQLYSDANNLIEIEYYAGNMTASVTEAGVVTALGSPVAYNATSHAWWRISEAGGTLTFATAPDGLTWTTLWSYVYYLDLSAMYVRVLGGDTA